MVYESHPGYDPEGTYVSEDGKEAAVITATNGVQAQHTKATFEHDDILPGRENSPVSSFEEIPIPMALAEDMREVIETQIRQGASFQFLDFSSLQGIEGSLSPAAQKGGDGTFTCVGLVEFAAEQARHNNGAGFIPNFLESFPFPDISILPPDLAIRELPLLSPQLLNYAMKSARALDNVQQWFQGLFDPVDFIITDPLGRRLGFTQDLGTVNEIPNAFFSGDGKLEQFLIPNPVAGSYEITLTGLGEQVIGGVSSGFQQKGINMTLPVGETENVEFEVELMVGAPGDANRDGKIDELDIDALKAKLNTFTNDPDDPCDIDGDGRVSENDLTLLERLIFGLPQTRILYRVNAGDPTISTIDSGPDWIGDDGFHSGGSRVVTGRTVSGLDSSVPSSTPREVFETERFNPPGTTDLHYDFNVDAGTQVEVRFYMMNGFDGTSEPGERIFDVEINGTLVFDDLDLSREFGHQIGGMRSTRVTSDGSIRIVFKRDVVQAPLINAIEIISVQP